ncbi:efflux RND transporter periplasmic adaptor subunit [Crateriforma conspicua]|uniref:HlyD family secretion protein n=1 Tax=Crateriforma conspicua TaxID=2527996 RepID=A0A5C5Y780_9PLAN|nr:efflux RND transporter periplasmic adaptor subunit [Crateriforma conspicua]TWT71526.1 HlyD family secretion protein [Crateriforma conspicua]
MTKLKWVKSLVGPLLVIAVVAGLWAYRDSLFETTAPKDDASSEAASGSGELEILELSAQARKNLELRSKAARPTDYWRTITIPGMVQDRPGISDRGVTSPAVGSVAEIHVFPGDTVRPGERLVTVALFSEYLQATQTQLFKATREISLLRKEIDRLSDLASSGGIAGSKLIQMENDIQRQETLTQAAKQELLNRGLSPSQVKQVVQGSFVSTIEVNAPPPRGLSTAERIDELSPVSQASFVVTDGTDPLIAYEVQSLAVELGQTVQAGQLIADLANHRHLYVVGHAFKREAGLLEKAAQEAREIEVEFSDDNAELWSPLDQSFQIRHLSNSIDVESRTFDFFVPLENQSRSYEKNRETFLVWRFRPGQRARIHVPVEKLDDVFVLPSEAIAREGPDAFVYRQNGDLFNQIAVNVLHEDRRSVVIANDGSITPGTYIAQNAGASLSRVLKSQSASGQQPGLHVHADGTVHAAH